ncbi:hypothetical protein [Pseudoxanthomonas winnipegensis]|jgi:hypothetical protein|uniref:Uncharacterized protein n=1 Tax=Rhodanobacter denitrificans TaxID=666685 RepID=A0A2W5KAN7_9GAMM|nr:hypothetical protein [Pseudoxanthomonas winnipegensis]PZQ13961.1 MAG: hypothetical protein DI564_10335 [Rhodanobacter denitrificans]RZZ90193.1 hypothetical protein EA663_00005 [Pseudoxanthomonas winnipegensis]
MRHNALYFPYIALPNEAWTTLSLLYWDRLLSIVPLDHLTNPEQMSDFMRSLLADGLVDAIVPDYHINRIERFDECFIEMIEGKLQRGQSRMATSEGEQPTTRIHAAKLGQIPRFLVEVGLAKEVGWPWYAIETTTAQMFMSYIAACLGELPEIDATPVTNKVTFTLPLRPRHPSSKLNPAYKHKSRDVVLRHLLPVPGGQIKVGQLLSFKEKHGHLLPSFRAKIEAHCTGVALLPDADDRIEADKAFLVDCEQSIAEIEEVMRPAFGKVIFGSLAPLFAAGFAIQAMEPGNTATRTGAALLFAGTAYQALANIQGSRAIKNRPLAYIAHARAAFPAS